jgi:hypothetical protein
LEAVAFDAAGARDTRVGALEHAATRRVRSSSDQSRRIRKGEPRVNMNARRDGGLAILARQTRLEQVFLISHLRFTL